MTEMSYDEVVAAAHADERELVAVERRGDRAVLRLCDPGKRNVLSAPLMVQLLGRAEGLARAPEVRVDKRILLVLLLGLLVGGWFWWQRDDASLATPKAADASAPVAEATKADVAETGAVTTEMPAERAP